MDEPGTRSESRRVSLLSRLVNLREGTGWTKAPPVESSLGIPRPQASETSADGDRRPPPLEHRLYLEAQRQIKRRAWGHAQRALEEAARREADGPASLDLISVRTIRRALHRTARWPSDVDAHLDLGRAYFDLDLGDAALAEFVLVQRLAPKRYEGFALATLEYLYRGDYVLAVQAWATARGLNAQLPPLEDVLGALPVK